MSNATKKVVATKVIRRGRAAGSMAEQLDRLQVGQTISTSERFVIGDVGVDGNDIKAALNSMRATFGTYVGRITGDNDGLDMRDYRTESGCFITDDKSAVIAVVAITRFS